MSAMESIVTRGDAERFADRIRLDLEGAADRIEAAKSKIRTAIIERHDLALGYSNPAAYLSDRFSDALGRLGVDSRREFISEIDAASTASIGGPISHRAMAAVVGADHSTISRDRARVADATPAPVINTETGEVSDDYVTDQTDLDQELPAEDVASSDDTGTKPSEAVESFPVPAPARSVTGLDGKTYTRPEPTKPRRTPLPDSIRNAVLGAETKLTTLRDLTRDDRWPRNAEEVAPRLRNDLMRLKDLLSQVEKSLPENEVTA